MSQIDKLIWPTMLLATGMLLLVTGFLYDLLFAGIPYQDPTPEMAASYDRHSTIATVIYWCGVLALLAGLIAYLLRSRVRRTR